MPTRWFGSWCWDFPGQHWGTPLDIYPESVTSTGRTASDPSIQLCVNLQSRRDSSDNQIEVRLCVRSVGYWGCSNTLGERPSSPNMFSQRCNFMQNNADTHVESWYFTPYYLLTYRDSLVSPTWVYTFNREIGVYIASKAIKLAGILRILEYLKNKFHDNYHSFGYNTLYETRVFNVMTAIVT